MRIGQVDARSRRILHLNRQPDQPAKNGSEMNDLETVEGCESSQHSPGRGQPEWKDFGCSRTAISEIFPLFQLQVSHELIRISLLLYVRFYTSGSSRPLGLVWSAGNVIGAVDIE